MMSLFSDCRRWVTSRQTPISDLAFSVFTKPCMDFFSSPFSLLIIAAGEEAHRQTERVEEVSLWAERKAAEVKAPQRSDEWIGGRSASDLQQHQLQAPSPLISQSTCYWKQGLYRTYPTGVRSYTMRWPFILGNCFVMHKEKGWVHWQETTQYNR